MIDLNDLEISIRDKKFNYTEELQDPWYMVMISSRKNRFSKFIAIKEDDPTTMLLECSKAIRDLINLYIKYENL